MNIDLLKIDPFEEFYKTGKYQWVNPKNVTGFDIKKEAEKIRGKFFKKDISDIDKEYVDQVILDYISPCFSSPESFENLTIIDYMDTALYLIQKLNSSYTAYIIHVEADHFLNDNLSDLSIAFNHFKSVYQEEKDDHIINLLRVFISNLFQYGNEWGESSDYRYNVLTEKELSYLNYIYTRKTSMPWSNY